MSRQLRANTTYCKGACARAARALSRSAEARLTAHRTAQSDRPDCSACSARAACVSGAGACRAAGPAGSTLATGRTGSIGVADSGAARLGRSYPAGSSLPDAGARYPAGAVDTRPRAAIQGCAALADARAVGRSAGAVATETGTALRICGAGLGVGKAAAATVFALAPVVAGMLLDVLPGRLRSDLDRLTARRFLVRAVTDLPLSLGRARFGAKRHPGERGDTRGQPAEGFRPAERRSSELFDQFVERCPVHGRCGPSTSSDRLAQPPLAAPCA
jgi:hypothetical protein